MKNDWEKCNEEFAIEMCEIETIQSMLSKPMREAIQKFGQERLIEAFYLLINGMKYDRNSKLSDQKTDAA